jgi:hypothetical protein
MIGFQFKDLQLEDGPEPGIHKQRMVKDERSEFQKILVTRGWSTTTTIQAKPGQAHGVRLVVLV